MKRFLRAGIAAMLGKEMLGVPVVLKVAGPGAGVTRGFRGWPGQAERKGRAKRKLKLAFAAALRRGRVRTLRQQRNAKWFRKECRKATAGIHS